MTSFISRRSSEVPPATRARLMRSTRDFTPAYLLLVSTPRTPQFKQAANDDDLKRSQRADLDWIRSRLKRKGYNAGAMRALATAYETFDAGEGLVEQVEHAAARRPALL